VRPYIPISLCATTPKDMLTVKQAVQKNAPEPALAGALAQLTHSVAG
jgi:hypothetical protein